MAPSADEQRSRDIAARIRHEADAGRVPKALHLVDDG
jgi:hypothetical protein